MRQIKPATVVGAPSGIAIKTRLHPSEEDEIALRALADLQGSLSGKDLRAALAGKTRQERKLALTAQSSSRWAGTWTGDNDAQVALATMAQRAHRDSVRAAIAAIESRLAVKVGKKAKVQVGSRTVTVSGYTSSEERWLKQQRLQHLRAVLVDLEADIAAGNWLADAFGNPVSRPINIPLLLAGSSGRRDGHLRWAISQLLAFCRAHQASRIYLEDLNFADGKSRESFGHRKQFRHLISSFPTAKFKNRLQAMAYRAGLELVAIDPANTSKRSKPWIKPTSTKTEKTSGHQAAAIAISRRGLSLSLSRRKGVTGRDQRIPAGGLPSRQRNHESSLRDKLDGQRRPGQGAPCSPNPSPPRPILAYLRPLKTVRSGPLTSHCQ